MNEESSLSLPQPISWLYRFSKFIRFSHTIFAAPFALGAMWIAADGLPEPRVLILILMCLLSARTLAMLFNRIVDWKWDRENPRTQGRHQLLDYRSAVISSVIFAIAFVICSAWINPLCGLLSPIALLLICGYSFTKRFTVYCHLFLGLALSAAPMGAWAAVTGNLSDPLPYCLAAGVLCWVFGFDLIYSLMDEKFDRDAGLFSFPSRFGQKRTLQVSRILHVMAYVLFGLFGWSAGLGWGYFVCWILMFPALAYEHYLTYSGSIEQINTAFFKMNALVSALFLLGVCLG
ncbi:MAG: 4-hydroxybenzoate octaprenyltransferase [Verrucomicrobiota bacterium]